MDRDRTENEQPRLVRTSLEKVSAQFSTVDLAVQDPYISDILNEISLRPAAGRKKSLIVLKTYRGLQ